MYIYLFLFCSVQIRTVKVSNISLAASQRDIKEFFSFSGDIQYVEMRRWVLLIGVQLVCLEK